MWLKRLSHSRWIMMLVIVTFIILVALISTKQQGFSQYYPFEPPLLPIVVVTSTSTRPAFCFPLPQEPTPIKIKSPTPDISRQDLPEGKIINNTPTALPLTRTIDLAPELSEVNKTLVYVYKCDGSWFLYKINPNVDYRENIPIEVGDVIWSVESPLSLMVHEPPEATKDIVIASFTPKFTYEVTPYPGFETFMNLPSQSPYPFPDLP